MKCMSKKPLYCLDDKISYICKNEYCYFLNKSNVVGVALGYKIKNGQCKKIKCIKVFVIKKLPKNCITHKNLIPSTYKGILTDVVEGSFPSACSLTSKVRPATCGYSISPFPPVLSDYSINTSGPILTGTLGCIVTDNKFYYVLSNNHILAFRNTLPVGTSIVQPGNKDDPAKPENIIAELTKFIPLKYINPQTIPKNYVDCAMAKPLARSLISTKITFLGRIKGVGTPTLGQKVQKVGRTTELTTGQITSLSGTHIVHFGSDRCLFIDQITTTKMSEDGDSGSVLLDSNMNALGLLFSNDSTISVFNPIENVLDALNVKIVTG